MRAAERKHIDRIFELLNQRGYEYLNALERTIYAIYEFAINDNRVAYCRLCHPPQEFLDRRELMAHQRLVHGRKFGPHGK